MKVKKGDKIKVKYTGTLENGTVFDSSDKHGPLEFVAGEGQMIPGFDKAVIEMEKGEEKEVTLQPENAYGEHNPHLIQKIQRDRLPKEELKPEMTILIGMQNGAQIPAKIVEINDKEATLDLNSPLAGKVLKFKIKLLEIL